MISLAFLLAWGIGNWGLGIGDWELGIGDWALEERGQLADEFCHRSIIWINQPPANE
ncbi:MAG: hypothetical protein WBA89_01750 [Microcoleus sp.]|uniref:hypothetical protein n=1 Tax=Microcoleus sp. TaxID=44472 RepID=UPI003C77E6F4